LEMHKVDTDITAQRGEVIPHGPSQVEQCNLRDRKGPARAFKMNRDVGGLHRLQETGTRIVRMNRNFYTPRCKKKFMSWFFPSLK
jgi:hypothetical protein